MMSQLILCQANIVRIKLVLVMLLVFCRPCAHGETARNGNVARALPKNRVRRRLPGAKRAAISRARSAKHEATSAAQYH